MIDVSVCVGSSCHLKGSYKVIQQLQDLIAAHHLEDRVHLSGSFCLSACGRGVTVKVNDHLFHTLPEQVADLFEQHIKHLLEV